MGPRAERHGAGGLVLPELPCSQLRGEVTVSSGPRRAASLGTSRLQQEGLRHARHTLGLESGLFSSFLKSCSVAVWRRALGHGDMWPTPAQRGSQPGPPVVLSSLSSPSCTRWDTAPGKRPGLSSHKGTGQWEEVRQGSAALLSEGRPLCTERALRSSP